MIESLSRKHPLFNPASRYNQMRAQVVGEDKMGGYWDWLCFQSNRAQEPLQPNESRPEVQRRELACLLTAENGRQCSVLDAVRLRVWVMSDGDLEAEREVWVQAMDEGELLLIREETGARKLGLLMHGQPRDWFPSPELRRGSCCRAFLLEPAVLDRLASALRAKAEGSYHSILLQTFQRETVANNYEVARLLCGVPEFEGEYQGDSQRVCFQRFPLPDDADSFPPHAGPLHVAVVFYQTEGTTANKGT